MAAAFGWTGHTDTDLNFSEFFAADHTLVVRFMPQRPNAYEGPLVAENGAGTFGIGQGEWLFGGQPNWGTKLYLAVGSQFVTYRTPLRAGTWYHLAMVARAASGQRTFTVYLDGAQLGQPLAVPTGASGLPQGTLRFGKRTTGRRSTATTRSTAVSSTMWRSSRARSARLRSSSSAPPYRT